MFLWSPHISKEETEAHGDVVTFSHNSARSGQNHRCFGKGICAYRESRSSRNIWDLEKAACLELNMVREMFPLGKSRATISATFFSIGPLRACHLKESYKFSMNSTASWVGPV